MEYSRGNRRIPTAADKGMPESVFSAEEESSGEGTEGFGMTFRTARRESLYGSGPEREGIKRLV